MRDGIAAICSDVLSCKVVVLGTYLAFEMKSAHLCLVPTVDWPLKLVKEKVF